MRRDLSRAHPQDRQYTIELVKALVTLGNIRRHMGEADPARRSFADARKAVCRSIEIDAERSRTPGRACRRAGQRGCVVSRLGQAEKAKPLLDDAADRFRRAAGRTASESELALDRERRSETLWDLARVCRGLELDLEADRSDSERTDLWKTRVPDELVELAIKHLNQATLIGHGKVAIIRRSRSRPRARSQPSRR